MSNDKKFLYEQMGGTYTEIDGIFYPNTTLGDEIAEHNSSCGKYSDMMRFVTIRKSEIHLTEKM